MTSSARPDSSSPATARWSTGRRWWSMEVSASAPEPHRRPAALEGCGSPCSVQRIGEMPSRLLRYGVLAEPARGVNRALDGHRRGT
jgi:hypothetical protein